MVKALCNVLWEVYIGVLGQGGAPIGPSPLLKINKSPTDYNILISTALKDKVVKCVLTVSGIIFESFYQECVASFN